MMDRLIDDARTERAFIYKKGREKEEKFVCGVCVCVLVWNDEGFGGETYVCGSDEE
jgi:hypothetical protein